MKTVNKYIRNSNDINMLRAIRKQKAGKIANSERSERAASHRHEVRSFRHSEVGVIDAELCFIAQMSDSEIEAHNRNEERRIDRELGYIGSPSAFGTPVCA